MADKNSTLQELQSEHSQKSAELNGILDTIGDRELTSDEVSQCEAIENELKQVELWATDAQTRGEKSKGFRDRASQRKNALGSANHRPGQGGGAGDIDAKTFGEAFVAGVKEYVQSIKGTDGKVNANTRVNSNSVGFEGMLKTLVTGASGTSGGALVVNDRSPIVTDRSPFRELHLRDVITQGTTESDAVDYALITGYTNNAAAVAEATASFGNSAMPGESGMTTSLETANVRDISHYIPISKRAVSDAGQVQTMVNNFLLFGLQDKLETLAISGDGLGENFLGILNTPGIQQQAFSSDIITTVRKGRTKLKTPGRVTPNVILVNPADWEAFDLEKDGEERYYFGGPTVLGNARVWGVTVIESEAVPQGTALMGDFKYAILWDRMAAEISMSDSPENFFLRKLVAVMGSLRAAFAVLYPKAFVQIDLTA